MAQAFRIKTHDGTAKAVKLNPPDTVLECCKKIATATGQAKNEHSLFLLPTATEPGKWLKEEYPFEFYGVLPMKPNDNAAVFVEFKNKSRALKLLLKGGTYTTVVVDDTLPVAQLVDGIALHVGIDNAAPLSLIEKAPNVEILNPDLTLRQQGLIGDITCGLFSRMGLDNRYGLYAQLPLWEGKLMRKRSGKVLPGVKAGGRANWMKRWYVLRKNQLAYFKSQDDDRALGFIDLTRCKIVDKISSRDTELLKEIPIKYRKLSFFLETSNRKYVFCVESVEEIPQWIEILNMARRFYSHYEVVDAADRVRRGLPSLPHPIASHDRTLSTKDYR